MIEHSINQEIWQKASEETRELWMEHHAFLVKAFGFFAATARTSEIASSTVKGFDGAELWVISSRNEDGEVQHEIGTENL